MATGDVVAIQVGNAKPQVHKDWTFAQICEAVGKVDRRLEKLIGDAEERLAVVRQEVANNPQKAVEYYIVQRARAEADNVVAAQLESLTPLERQERVAEYHRYHSVGSALLYGNFNLSGTQKFFTIPWPKFSWHPYHFNDKASSAQAWGFNVLHQHVWYEGKKLYLVGIPYIEIRDFRELDFNDRASSYSGL